MIEDPRSIIIKTYVDWVQELNTKLYAQEARLKELSGRCLMLTEENEALLWELSLLHGPKEGKE